MDEQEYDLTIPANRRDLINVIEAVTPKAGVRLKASIGRNRPTAVDQITPTLDLTALSGRSQILAKTNTVITQELVACQSRFHA